MSDDELGGEKVCYWYTVQKKNRNIKGIETDYRLVSDCNVT